MGRDGGRVAGTWRHEMGAPSLAVLFQEPAGRGSRLSRAARIALAVKPWVPEGSAVIVGGLGLSTGQRARVPLSQTAPSGAGVPLPVLALRLRVFAGRAWGAGLLS